MKIMDNTIPGRRFTLLAFFVIVVVTGGVYANSLLNGFVMDDEIIIESNPATHNLNNIGDVLFAPDVIKPYYRPLNRASYLIDYQLFGHNPMWFHAVNVAIHLLNALLLYLVACRLLGNRGAALMVSLLFSVHPANSEAVNFISARNTLLAVCFSLASLLSFLNAQEKGVRLPLLSPFLFFLGLLSKETAFMMIAVITIYMFFPSLWTGAKMLRDKLIFLLPFLFATASYFAMRSYSLQGLLGAEIPADGLFSRLSLNYHIIPQYVGLLLFPADLTVFHAVPKGGILNPPWFLPVWAALLAMVWLAIRSRQKAALFGLIWCALNYVPISNIVPIPSDPITERFLYMPAIGFFIVLGALFGRLNARVRSRQIVNVAFVVILLLFASVTIERNRDWRDDYSLYLSGVKNDPASAEAHCNLGTAFLEDKGDMESARREWEVALRIDPLNSDALTQMGTYAAVTGDLRTAEQFYAKALVSPPGKSDPDKSLTHFNLGKIYDRQNRLEDARQQYELFLKFVNLRYAEYKPFAEQRISYLSKAISSGSK
jgi:tetratricopeptide (TPR) repeat protein